MKQYSILIAIFALFLSLFSTSCKDKDDDPKPVTPTAFFQLDSTKVTESDDHLVVTLYATIANYHSVTAIITPDPALTGVGREFRKNAQGIFVVRTDILKSEMEQFDVNTIHFGILAQETLESDRDFLMQDVIRVHDQNTKEVLFIFHPEDSDVNGGTVPYSITNPTDDPINIDFSATDGNNSWQETRIIPAGADLKNQTINITGMSPGKKVILTAEIAELEYTKSFRTEDNIIFSAELSSPFGADSVEISPDQDRVHFATFSVSASGNSDVKTISVIVNENDFSDSTAIWDYSDEIGVGEEFVLARRPEYWNSIGGSSIAVTVNPDQMLIGKDHIEFKLYASWKAFSTYERVPCTVHVNYDDNRTVEATIDVVLRP